MFFKNFLLDLVLIWTCINNGNSHGRNAFVKLAIHVLSIVANSAGTECTFSSFGITHTKHHNKLRLKKYMKLLYSRWASAKSIKQLASFTLTRSVLLVICPNLPHQPVSLRL
jgi:hypothetical protein